jgi:CPA1 family monovalent cation:H+ antiporter
MSIEKSACVHYKSVALSTPRGAKCEECGVDAPLRVCLTCGHVGCCESSKGHAKAHAVGAKHPLIRQLPLREASFTWCYECNDYLR